MAITFNYFTSNTGVATGDDTFSCTSTAGNILVAAIIADNALDISSVMDTKGNLWDISNVATGAGETIFAAYALGAATGVTYLEILSTGADGSSSIAVGLYDFGSVTGGVFDVVTISNNETGSVIAGITPTSSGVVVASAAIDHTPTGVGSPFTFKSMSSTGLISHAATAYDLNPSAGLLQPTFSISGGGSVNWGAVLLSIKEAPSRTRSYAYIM